jgi:hypothetical protein
LTTPDLTWLQTNSMNLGSGDELILCSLDLDLAPSDFWLFTDLNHCLEGQSFEDNVALQAAVMETLIGIGPDVFMREFAERECGLQQCIDRGGD